MKITKDNVQDLWILYEEYGDDYKNFEDFVEDVTKCENCNEYVPVDEMGTSELARTDHICNECMTEGGYGR